MRPLTFALLACAITVACPFASTAADSAADLVVTDAKIYTVDGSHSTAQSLAVREGKIVFVGTSAEARHWVGPKTKVRRLGGRLVLPGLFDSHLHPIAMMKVRACDLQNQRKSLRELTAFVRACLKKYSVSEGGWLNVHQWNFADGNQPDDQFPTLVSALDEASGHVAIQLIGTDGHHCAYNSVALARARNSKGEMIGFTRESLAGDFAAFRQLIGVDADGNPNGAVNENAKLLMGAPNILFADFEQALAARSQLSRLLGSAGITGILDANVSAKTLKFYDALERDGKLTFRATLAQFYDPEQYKTPAGEVDYPLMLAQAMRVRAKYANNPFIRADVVKLYADGSLEGNPFATPPTLPNAASLHPYLQPLFAKDEKGNLTVRGYVDTGSTECVEVRQHPDKYDSAAEVRIFAEARGFHPGQCAISSGQLRHDRAVIMEFTRQFHLAGFALHVHVIADGGLSAALDALEAARASDGIATQHDGLAHVQLAAPADVARIGRDRLFVAFTYSWANTDPEYDMTVVPFIDRVSGSGYAALHRPGNYFETNAYPFKSVAESGGTLVAGSDAPVESRDPRPFVNMAAAVTRRRSALPPLNPAQAVTLRAVIDAYTINGARFLNRDAEAGSLEVGKSADFVVLDRDILALADGGRADEVALTHVLETWFQGNRVYMRQRAGS